MKNNIFLDEYFKKRKSYIVRSLLIFLLFLILSTFLLTNNKPTPFIAKVYVDGIIYEKTELLERLSHLSEDKNLRGLLVKINSPGGTFVSSRELFDSIKDLGKQIPTAVYMKEVATSGGYLLSLGADRIFSNQGTITGSVGVILQTADLTELFEKIGINPIVIKSGEFKAVPNPIEKIDKRKIDYISEVVLVLQQEFINIVRDRRKIPDYVVKEISDGRIFTATQALDLNLIDQIGSERDAIDWIKKEASLEDDVEIIDFSQEENIFSFLKINNFKNKIKKINVNFLSGFLAIWTPSL